MKHHHENQPENPPSMAIDRRRQFCPHYGCDVVTFTLIDSNGDPLEIARISMAFVEDRERLEAMQQIVEQGVYSRLFEIGGDDLVIEAFRDGGGNGG